MGKTLATVRLGPDHHVISLVAKIDPSPDWILGVAGLELCLANCTWIEKKVLNLYPWDVGTDSGPSYMVNLSFTYKNFKIFNNFIPDFEVTRSGSISTRCYKTYKLDLSQ